MEQSSLKIKELKCRLKKSKRIAAKLENMLRTVSNKSKGEISKGFEDLFEITERLPDETKTTKRIILVY